MVDNEGFTSTYRRQVTSRGPPEFHTLQDATQPAIEQEVPPMRQHTSNSPQVPPNPVPQARTPQTGNHSNHPSESQSLQVSQEPHAIASSDPSTPHEQPNANLPNQGGIILVSYDTSGGTPQLRIQNPTPVEEAQDYTMRDSVRPLRLQFPTQRLDEPTQPFLTFDLDLNIAADGEENSRSNLRSASASLPSACTSSSRSRSRSPTRGKTNLTSPRRNSSPKHKSSFLRDSPPGAGPFHTS